MITAEKNLTIAAGCIAICQTAIIHLLISACLPRVFRAASASYIPANNPLGLISAACHASGTPRHGPSAQRRLALKRSGCGSCWPSSARGSRHSPTSAGCPSETVAPGAICGLSEAAERGVSAICCTFLPRHVKGLRLKAKPLTIPRCNKQRLV